MVLNKNNSKVHNTPVTTNHFLILNIVGDTQEATCPMPILLLFYLGNRLVFFSTFTVQREKESRKRGRDGERDGMREEKNGLYFPACPAAESVLFQQRGTVFAG